MSKEDKIEKINYNLDMVKKYAKYAADGMESVNDRQGAKTARRWAKEAGETGPKKKGPR